LKSKWDTFIENEKYFVSKNRGAAPLNFREKSILKHSFTAAKEIPVSKR
jgi:hypothetical protein